MDGLEGVAKALGKAAEGMQFQEVSLAFFKDKGRLGIEGESTDATDQRSFYWKDPEQSGFYSRDKEFVAKFGINGRNFLYGSIQYSFMDGRSKMDVQEEILLERIHDALASLAARLRKNEKVS